MSKFEDWINSNKRGAYNVDGRYEGFMIPEYAVRAFMKGAQRFEKTYCSSCGGEFGPGEHGYSHCSDHPQ
jgi:hypothetical protein